MTPFQKLSKNVGDLGKLIVAKGFKKLPKSNKSPNLVTLIADHNKSRKEGGGLKRFNNDFSLPNEIFDGSTGWSGVNMPRRKLK